MANGSAPRGVPRILQWLLAGLMAIVGLAVGGLGLKLATVGGSWYFLIVGIVMVVAAVLIFINRTSGIVLYAVAFIASLFWAVSDAGWDFWPLFSRLFTLAVLAFLCAVVWPYLRAAQRGTPVAKAPAFGIAAVLAVAMLASLGWMFKPQTLVAANEAVPVKPVAPAKSKRTGSTGATPPTAIASPRSTRLTSRT
jgi:Glucose dehydrogenase